MRVGSSYVKLPNVQHAPIEREKSTDYLLSTSDPNGPKSLKGDCTPKLSFVARCQDIDASSHQYKVVGSLDTLRQLGIHTPIAAILGIPTTVHQTRNQSRL